MEEILLSTHPHKLFLYEVIFGKPRRRCKGCFHIIRDVGYNCYLGNCDFSLHKSCAIELPDQIEKHSFHPEHPLTLWEPDVYICNGCGDLSETFSFRCIRCKFFLDMKCAVLCLTGHQRSDNLQHDQKLGREIVSTIMHFGHDHPLIRCNFPWEEEGVNCAACNQVVFGLVYVCLSCGILHESCVNDMPKEVQSQFHPSHPLFPKSLNTDDYSVKCYVCKDDISVISFCCYECKMDLHVSCAKYRSRAIKDKCHEHLLRYFDISSRISTTIECKTCRTKDNGTFFCCVECEFYIHMACIPLPKAIKHIRHMHQLELIDCVIEDESGEYYCDICETERNAEHHVYYCKECAYIAHIDCVISEVNIAHFDCVISEVEPPEEVISYVDSREVKLVQDDKQLKAKSERVEEDSDELNKLERRIKEVREQIEHLTKELEELEESMF